MSKNKIKPNKPGLGIFVFEGKLSTQKADNLNRKEALFSAVKPSAVSFGFLALSFPLRSLYI